ncbi:PIG-L deacetylase family protein [Micromonospora andamanensis]|nr:PIG-L family deacetylase [Micromonospora andamanensis]
MSLAGVSVLRPGTAIAAGTTPVIFAAAHPDDETLAMSVAIAKHAAAGQAVHVLLLTDGEGSGVIGSLNGTTTSKWWGVRHVPSAEGYAPLTPADLAAARVRELTTALKSLFAGLPGSVTLHRAGLPDGGVTTSTARAAILSLADEIAPGAAVRIKGHSHAVDDHRDHIAIGQALVALSAEDPTRFSDRRHYILPHYWSDPRLSRVAYAWDMPGDASIAARARNACNSYRSWAPANGHYAIGYHSVPEMFDALTGNIRSMYHS